MKSKKNLVLLGMMGSGKSSIGSIISKKLNIELIDIDKEIEKKLEMKISDIFRIKGEKFFREFEENIALYFLKKNKVVIALGGGTFLNTRVKYEILQNHISFWLNWNTKTLLDRIKNSRKRPIAFSSSKNELIKLIQKRSIIYSKAMYKIECENRTKNEIANKISSIYETC